MKSDVYAEAIVYLVLQYLSVELLQQIYARNKNNP